MFSHLKLYINYVQCQLPKALQHQQQRLEAAVVPRPPPQLNNQLHLPPPEEELVLQLVKPNFNSNKVQKKLQLHSK